MDPLVAMEEIFSRQHKDILDLQDKVCLMEVELNSVKEKEHLRSLHDNNYVEGAFLEECITSLEQQIKNVPGPTSVIEITDNTITISDNANNKVLTLEWFAGFSHVVRRMTET